MHTQFRNRCKVSAFAVPVSDATSAPDHAYGGSVHGLERQEVLHEMRFVETLFARGQGRADLESLYRLPFAILVPILDRERREPAAVLLNRPGVVGQQSDSLRLLPLVPVKILLRSGFPTDTVKRRAVARKANGVP